MSISPRLRAFLQSAVFISATVNVTSGLSAVILLKKRGSKYGAMVGSTPIRHNPPTCPFSSATMSFILRALAKTRHACSTTSLPIAVGVTCWEERSKILMSSSASSFCIIALRVGWVTPHCSAALAKWRNRYTATIYSICCNVIVGIILLCKDKYYYRNKQTNGRYLMFFIWTLASSNYRLI